MSKKQKYLKLLKETCLNAQLHGIPRVISSKRIFLKFLWIFSLLSSGSVCFYLFRRALKSYFEYSVVTNINSISENPMPFPSVTICSLLPPVKDYNLTDIIFYCSFNNVRCNKEPEFIKVDYQYQQVKPCYQFNLGYKNGSVLTSFRPGLANGLYLKLFEGLYDEPRNKNFGIHKSVGFQVFIHNKSEIVLSETNFIIQPGLSTYISIKKIVDTKLSEPYNNCIKDIDTYRDFNSSLYKEILESNYKYSQKNCLDYQFLKSINCTSSYYKSFEYCDSKMFLKYIEVFYKYYREKIYLNYLDNCPLECDTITFQTTISHSYYPSYEEYQNLLKTENLISKFPNKEKTTIDEMRKSVYELFIYFEDLKYTFISQQPKLDIWDLVSNIGGLFGLFLGLSFLSLIDLIHVLTEIIVIYFEFD